MKQQLFESEYADSVVPSLHGTPATHAALNASANAEIPWTQMSVLLGTTVIQAVQSFYLAKRSWQYFEDLPDRDDRVGRAVDGINRRLMRLAVLDIAGINDGGQPAKDPGNTRTASLPIVHKRMKQQLSSCDAPIEDLERLQNLQSSINSELFAPLKYVRHLRNKWAGHPSLDRRFDTWAGADESLSIAAVEKALERLVNTAQETANLALASSALENFRKPPVASNLDGRVNMEFDLSNVVLFAELMRESAGKEVRALRAQIDRRTFLERFAQTEKFDGQEF